MRKANDHQPNSNHHWQEPFLLEDFAKAIEEKDSTLITSLLSNRKVDVNARLSFDPPALRRDR
jgi:hypothetical protein